VIFFSDTSLKSTVKVKLDIDRPKRRTRCH